MKRVLLVLLTLGLMLALVAGCGAATTPAPTSAPAAAATTAPAPTATTAPTAAPTASPTAVPTKTPAPTATPTPAATSSDVLNKMKTIRGFSADFTSESAGEKVEGKMVFGSNKMRMDVEAMGAAVVVLVDQEKKMGYMYNPQEKKALAVPFNQAVESADPWDMLDWEKSMTAPPVALGEETVDGKACAIYQFTTADGTSKTWIDKATGFPIKSETTAGGETAKIHFTNVKIGDVDESLLALPPGTEIIDMSALTGVLATPTATGATPTTGSTLPTPAGGSADALTPAAIVGPVAAELKQSIPIPSGFSLLQDSGQRVENSDTGVFRAMATWTGNASMQQIADFYAALLTEGWESQGGEVGDDIVDVRYDQNDTEPVVFLKVQAEPVGAGSTILGEPNYDNWLRRKLQIEGIDSGVILTLTIANGDPDQ